MSVPESANPYVAPPAERYSPQLTRNERDLLIGLLDVRERPPFHRLLARTLPGTLSTLPFAAAFAILFPLVFLFATGLPNGAAASLAGVAFAASLAGSLFRDLVDATNTQTLWEALNRITDFDEAERLLYDRSEPVAKRLSAEEALAAIPVEEEPQRVEDRTR